MQKLTIWIADESEDAADALHMQLCTGGRLRWMDRSGVLCTAIVVETELESDE